MRERADMTFPMTEHRRRLEDLRRRMAERRLDAVIITDPENLFYLTEYQTTGYSYFQALVVGLETEPLMVTRLLEESNVHARTWVEYTRPYSDTGDAIETLWQALREFGLDRERIGYERNSYYFPAYQQDRMRATFLFGQLVDCFGIVEEARIVKSEHEIDVMRAAGRATQASMQAGIEAVAAGVNENEIAAAVHAAMFRAGGEYPAVSPYITSGPRCLIGHATWEGRQVEPDECVFLELAGCYRRYHTAMMRTCFTGEPPAAMREAERVVEGAIDQLLAAVRPGCTAGEIYQLTHQAVHDNAVGGRQITRAGYSIGIAFAPSWDEGYMLSLKAGERMALRENMTLHLIPWMYGIEDSKVMAQSETVRVTADGCERLCDFERGLFVRG